MRKSNSQLVTNDSLARQATRQTSKETKFECSCSLESDHAAAPLKSELDCGGYRVRIEPQPGTGREDNGETMGVRRSGGTAELTAKSGFIMAVIVLSEERHKMNRKIALTRYDPKIIKKCRA